MGRKAAGFSHATIRESEAEAEQVSVCTGRRHSLTEPSSQPTKPPPGIPGHTCFPQPKSYGAGTFLRDTDPSFENVVQELGPKDPLGVM